MKTPGNLADPRPRDIARLCTLGLTRREAEVLFWIAQGKTNDEIASILAIGFETVKTYVTRILRRLDVTNRTAAGIVASDTLRAEPAPAGGDRPRRRPGKTASASMTPHPPRRRSHRHTPRA